MKRSLVLAAVVALVAPAVAQASTPHHVDLATGFLDGHRVLGRTVAGVTAALGRPDHVDPRPSRYALGWGSRADPAVDVLFRRSGGRQRAWSIVVRSTAVRDAKVGSPLLRRSKALQAAILADYPGAYRVLGRYSCEPTGVCSGELVQRSGPLHLTFGTVANGARWLTIWERPAGV